MKLLKVEHMRCNEYNGRTYLLTKNDNITEEEFENDVEKAQKAYLSAKEEFDKENKKPSYLTTSIRDFPDNLTIKEAKELLEERKKEIKKWNEDRDKYSRSFGSHMKDLGYIPLGWEDEDDLLNVIANWGHRHGENIDQTNTKYNTFKRDIDESKKGDDDLYGF